MPSMACARSAAFVRLRCWPSLVGRAPKAPETRLNESTAETTLTLKPPCIRRMPMEPSVLVEVCDNATRSHASALTLAAEPAAAHQGNPDSIKIAFALRAAAKVHLPRTLLHFVLSLSWFPTLPDSEVLKRRALFREECFVACRECGSSGHAVAERREKSKNRRSPMSVPFSIQQFLNDSFLSLVLTF